MKVMGRILASSSHTVSAAFARCVWMLMHRALRRPGWLHSSSTTGTLEQAKVNRDNSSTSSYSLQIGLLQLHLLAPLIALMQSVLLYGEHHSQVATSLAAITSPGSEAGMHAM